MLSKLPKSTNSLENVGQEANREKTSRKLKHIDVEVILEAILVSFWGTWEAFGSHVETNLGPAWAQLEPTWSQLGSMLGPDRLN